MTEYIVIQTSPDQNLGEFSRYLWRHKVSHRIVVEGDKQLLLVGNRDDAEQVSNAFRAYISGETALPDIAPASGNSSGKFLAAIRSAPVTAILIALSLAGFALVEFDPHFEIVSWFTFFDFKVLFGGQTLFSLPPGEYWRLITPIFLHFGWLHITFNSLMLWELGKRVEALQGSDRMIGIVMVMGLGSNIAQSVYAGANIFGGMSGVIYGLLGYAWIWSALCPRHSLGIPKALLIFMLGSMVLFMFGAASLLNVGAVANAAHVGGLVMGMILGAAAGLIARSSGNA